MNCFSRPSYNDLPNLFILFQ